MTFHWQHNFLSSNTHKRGQPILATAIVLQKHVFKNPDTVPTP